jgi:hypothetical protein
MDTPTQSPIETPVLRLQYQDITQEIAKLKARLDAVKTEIRSRMGETTLDAGDGFTFALQVRQTKTYDKTVLREYMDEDQLEVCLIPDKDKVGMLLPKLSLTPEAHERIRNTMLVTAESTSLVLRTAKKEPKQKYAPPKTEAEQKFEDTLPA